MGEPLTKQNTIGCLLSSSSGVSHVTQCKLPADKDRPSKTETSARWRRAHWNWQQTGTFSLHFFFLNFKNSFLALSRWSQSFKPRQSQLVTWWVITDLFQKPSVTLFPSSLYPLPHPVWKGLGGAREDEEASRDLKEKPRSTGRWLKKN